MNERIKKLRMALTLTQQGFADKKRGGNQSHYRKAKRQRGLAAHRRGGNVRRIRHFQLRPIRKRPRLYRARA